MNPKLLRFNFNKFVNSQITILIVALTFLFLNNVALAQVKSFGKTISIAQSNQPYKTISFGEKVFFGDIESTVTWTVINTADKIAVSLNGNQINDFVFKTPGVYELSFFENKTYNKDECFHPQFDSKMIISVSSIKMTYDFSNISFSQKINKGQRCDGIILTVPVNFEIAESEKTFTLSDFSVSGIGVNLKGSPINNQIIVKNGTQLLKYVLTGIVNNETYIMFDFIDINNNVQTYNLPQIIN